MEIDRVRSHRTVRSRNERENSEIRVLTMMEATGSRPQYRLVVSSSSARD